MKINASQIIRKFEIINKLNFVVVQIYLSILLVINNMFTLLINNRAKGEMHIKNSFIIHIKGGRGKKNRVTWKQPL